jgi:hypothetical protein
VCVADLTEKGAKLVFTGRAAFVLAIDRNFPSKNRHLVQIPIASTRVQKIVDIQHASDLGIRVSYVAAVEPTPQAELFQLRTQVPAELKRHAELRATSSGLQLIEDVEDGGNTETGKPG